ncbi:16S rRNA (adenine(1518)-N(6)/adenine(1519)-N(6))-dimethyltransferase RsmA [Spirochaeta isovalerica]|uniref:Ribosomal RNA small subunit methyltransferase A n=1 Tax=Spirochaeta isovalerica TaxID=150 RepID=A0A841RC89_9SPIO|nr:16S rRNA (adenine(1518)-N(6)/adenine(1519)-N(6))-dimethyltransferase RsmA [Spirochaeta isovalerica]MBB6480620.1 16S rRNA (adenine1518-N6/adenine1519-N6)-dimethyltransferase [Spirochaeta isovalerica]
MEEERNLNLNYDSPTEIKALLELMGLGPRKKWSQNFLINRNARQRLVDTLEIHEGDRIWEIGPGLGAITKHILEKKADLTVFEIDPGYIEYLSMAFADEKVKVVKGDVIKTWKDEYEISGSPEGVIGNFPYNAASAIIASFIENRTFPRQLAAIVQSEMADRVTARPGTKNYSSFSIICQYACDVKDAGAIGSGSFYPKPNVSSKIIKMTPRKDAVELLDPELFFILVRDCFSSRRKTLQNNLKNAAARRLQKYGTELLFHGFESQGIALSARAETVTVDQYAAIANEISRQFKAQ